MELYGQNIDMKLLRAAPTKNDELEELFDSVVAEIEERQEHLTEMAEMGNAPEVEEQMKNEICERIAEL